MFSKCRIAGQPILGLDTHAGCDFGSFGVPLATGLFQSTHPRGVRLLFETLFEFLHLFQSTHPRGVRLDDEVFAALETVFQSPHP